jgi:tRNA dimethylallyltransferase
MLCHAVPFDKSLARLQGNSQRRVSILFSGENLSRQMAMYLAARPLSALLLLTQPPEEYLAGELIYPLWCARNSHLAALVPSDRSVLHRRIEKRFDEMLELGLIGELRQLREAHALDPELPSMRCVGYRQAWAYLDGRTSLGQLRSTGIAATRQLAKRQLTWLRSMPQRHVVDCQAENATAKVLTAVEALMAGDAQA